MSLDLKVFPIDNSFGFVIHKLDTMLAAGLGRAFRKAGYDLTAEQWGVLSKLWEVEGLHQSELAQRLGKDRHNMTRILSVLEKNGLIQKKHDPGDKRRLKVYLSGRGREIRAELTGIATAYGNRCLEGFDRKDFELLMGMHRRIIENANGENVNGENSNGTSG